MKEGKKIKNAYNKNDYKGVEILAKQEKVWTWKNERKLEKGVELEKGVKRGKRGHKIKIERGVEEEKEERQKRLVMGIE